MSKSLKNNILLFIFLIFFSNINAQEFSGLTFGGNQADKGFSICKSTYDSYLITGSTRTSSSSNECVFIKKISATGNEIWSKTFFTNSYSYAKSITLTSNNCFIIAGYLWFNAEKRTQAFLLKIDNNGNELWSNFFGAGQTEQAFCVKELKNKEIIFLGYSRSNTNPGDFYLVKTSSEGEHIWTKYYSTESVDYGFSCEETDDEGFLLVGSAGGFYNNVEPDFQTKSSDILFIKTDKDGNELWRNFYGGNNHDFGNSILKINENEIFILGSTQSIGNGSFDMYLIKTDSIGTKISEKNYGGSDFEYGNSIILSKDNNLLLLGSTASYSDDFKPDAYLVKTDLFGNKIWEIIIGGIDSDYGYSMVSNSDSSCTILGSTKSFGNGNFDIMMVNIDENGIPTSFLTNSNSMSNNSNVKIYPNPFNNISTLEINDTINQNNEYSIYIYDNNGNLVRNSKLISKSTKIYKENLSSGVYSYKIINKNSNINFGGKFIIY